MATSSRSNHRRSISHPFPSIFGHRKATRSGSTTITNSGATMSEITSTGNPQIPIDTSDDDDFRIPSKGHSSKFKEDLLGLRNVTIGLGRGRQQEPRTGSCMTCDSKVKWPENQTSFRCSECSTVNDTTYNPTPLGDKQGANVSHKSSSAHPITVDQIRSIIRTCIVDYLRARQGHVKSRQVSQRLASQPIEPRLSSAQESKALGPTSMGYPPPFSMQVQSDHFPARKPLPIEIDQTVLSIPLQSRNPFRNLQSFQPLPSLPNLKVIPRNFAHPPSRSASLVPRSPEVLSATPSSATSWAGTTPTTGTPVNNISPRIAFASCTPDGLEQRPQFGDHKSAGDRTDKAKDIFGPLEDYLVRHFGKWASLNASFHTCRQKPSQRTHSEGSPSTSGAWPKRRPMGSQNILSPSSQYSPSAYLEPPLSFVPSLSQTTPAVDAKSLLVGRFSETGDWGNEDTHPSQNKSGPPRDSGDPLRWLASSRSPMINWPEMTTWYDSVLNAGRDWRDVAQSFDLRVLPKDLPDHEIAAITTDIERELQIARIRVHRTLLRVTEAILKRPGQPLQEHYHIRFIFILLANPLFHASLAKRYNESPISPPEDRMAVPHPHRFPFARSPKSESATPVYVPGNRQPPVDAKSHRRVRSSEARQGPGLHPDIVKRMVGLISNLPPHCHRIITSWLVRYPEDWFRRHVDLISSFVTHRLMRQEARKNSKSPTTADLTLGLIPQFNTALGTSSTMQLHTALGSSNVIGTGLASLPAGGVQQDRRRNEELAINLQAPMYSDDWQLRAASKTMGLLFTANNTHYARRGGMGTNPSLLGGPVQSLESSSNIRAPRQLLPTSYFYNSWLDYSGSLIADFESWELRKFGPNCFSFCQFPFFLSIGAKIRILQYDAKRQMENKAREAFFDSLLNGRAAHQYFNLKVRRDCLAEDSLVRVSESVASGSGLDEVKKGLRVQFVGEDGIDAGGLRKEWFLLLVRELFEPNMGMFSYDDDSKYCYFNPFTLEKGERFYLVGAVLGLAIYNSTILDVQLPPFAFRKLLAAAPQSSIPPSERHAGKGSQPHAANRHPPPPFSPSLDDLAQLHPTIARSLQQLLAFEPDSGRSNQNGENDPVAETFGLTFSISVDNYGSSQVVDLVRGGDKVDVTLSNRHEFVNLYVRYLLEDSVARQFEPFKRGFWSVCAGNAIELFQPEEVELLVRGADEPLNVQSLKAVSVNEGFSHPVSGAALTSEEATDQIQVIKWFWQMLEEKTDVDRRRLVGWITGSDRVPAAGTASLVIRVVCAGEVGNINRTGRVVVRLPVARTCFNMIQLPLYRSREELEDKLWSAVTESGGFGLK